MRTEGCYLNITSKFVAITNTKKSQTVSKSWLSQLAEAYEISAES